MSNMLDFMLGKHKIRSLSVNIRAHVVHQRISGHYSEERIQT